MTGKDRARLDTMRSRANRLLDSPPRMNPVVRTIDVLEAVLDDVRTITGGREPLEVAKLVTKAQGAGEL
jgi:hypothetical protein